MSVKQTESKITALYERLSRDDDQAGDSTTTPLSIRKNTSKAMPHKGATKTASTIPMTGTAEELLNALRGSE